MTTTHDKISFFAGDTWQIFGTASDVNGALSLVGATVEWKLDDLDDVNSLLMTISNGGIVLTNAALGQFIVLVVSSRSAPVPPGLYKDQLRVTTLDGVVSVQWDGLVEVQQAI